MEFRVYSKSERLVRRLTADLVVEEPKKATLFVFPDPGPVSDVASAAQIVAKRGGIIVADGEVPQIAMARPEPWMFSGRCVCGSVWGPLSETGWYCPTCGARTVLIPWGEVDQLIRVLETGVSFQVTPRTDAVALTTWFRARGVGHGVHTMAERIADSGGGRRPHGGAEAGE